MSQNTQTKSLKEVLENVQSQLKEKETVYRFDVFKGVEDHDGKVVKVKSVGAAYIREGLKTYTMHLKTFLKDSFYLLPNNKLQSSNYDYVILTREAAQNINRKYFWNNVGEGKLLDGPNHGLMKLSWDVFSQNLYMNLHPVNTTDATECEKANAA